MECVIRFDGRQHLLSDRATGVEYARGTEAQVRLAAQGRHTVTEAPRLGPVREVGQTLSGHPEFAQLVAETVPFQGRQFVTDVDIWTDGVLYPDHLGIGFTERIADVPQFVRGVETTVGRTAKCIRGVASVAASGDPPLLGDWILAGLFQPDRLARRFSTELGGRWVVVRLKYLNDPAQGHIVEFSRQPGT